LLETEQTKGTKTKKTKQSQEGKRKQNINTQLHRLKEKMKKIATQTNETSHTTAGDRPYKKKQRNTTIGKRNTNHRKKETETPNPEEDDDAKLRRKDHRHYRNQTRTSVKLQHSPRKETPTNHR
jgi:hypothetical protein